MSKKTTKYKGVISTKTVALIGSFVFVMLTGCNDKNDAKAVDPASKKVSQTTVINDFDQAELSLDIVAQGATFEHQHKNNAGNILIDFSKDSYVSSVSLKPKKAWDFSENEIHLALDAKNTGTESVQLYLSLAYSEDPDNIAAGTRTGSANYAVNIAPGESGTYFVVLSGKFIDTQTGIRDNPVPWQTDDKMFVWRYGTKDMDLSKVNELSFLVRGTLADKQVSIDNIRLKKNPTYNNDYLHHIVDEFGQNAKQSFPIKVNSAEALRAAADKELAQLKAEGPMKDRSRFGGWKSGPKFEATGYFRTQKVDDQWWMVDPEGYLFFSHGVANVRMANTTTITGVDFHDDAVRYVDPNEVTPEDSIGIVNVSDEVMKTRYISSELRHNMFSWLPDYDEPLAKHYSYRRSVHKGPVTSGETFSFYRANLERRYGNGVTDDYIRKWEEVTLERMNNWGFTSFGNWVDPAFYTNEKVPYFANGWIIGDFKTLKSEHDVWAPLPDPFDAEFANRAKITIDVIAEEIKGSPWCAGVFIDNEKSWGFPTGTPQVKYGVIISTLTRSDDDSPAKKVFTDYLKSQYQTIEKFNQAWQLSLSSWDEVSAGVEAKSYTTKTVNDLSHMLEMLSEQYFKVVHDTLAAALPNHLYMGARMANFGMPKETIKASVKYSDVLSFNIYEEGVQPHQWDFLNEIDLPTVIGEFHIGAMSDTGLFHPGLVMASDQTDRAKMYQEYMKSVARHKNMVGAHWFQYLDSPITGRAFDGEPYNVGFVSTTDIPYPEMVKAAKEFNSTIYSKRYNKAFK
ncbi:agarase [Thalassotalea agariperforans]